MKIAPFLILRRSLPTNSFGLRGYWAIGQDNHVWEFAAHMDAAVGESVPLPCALSVSPGSPDMLRPCMELCHHRGFPKDRAALLKGFGITE